MPSMRLRLTIIGTLTAVALPWAAAIAATAGPTATFTAEELLAYAQSQPSGNGGGATSTGPGGATLPGLGGASVTPPASRPAVPQGVPAISPLTQQTAAAAQFRPNELLVVLQPGATLADAQALALAFNLQLETLTPSRLLKTPVARFRIPDGRPVPAVAAALAADPRVRASQPNYLYRPVADQTARKQALPQYALDVIGAAAAQSGPRGPRRPLVAIIDTGIDETHPDLKGSVQARFDAVDDGAWDVGPHGTSIAGIIAAHGQLLGVAPDAVLLSVRAFAQAPDGTAQATSDSLRRGLDWAAEQNADVINMSLAGPEEPIVDTAVTQAIAEGIVVVAAAGNGGPAAEPAYPAAIKGVIAVTATDQQDALFSGANHGAYIAVSAPGVDILSDTPGGSFTMMTGTSQAAAHVSGLIAVMRGLRPNLTPAEALDILSRNAKDLGPPGKDDSFGAGRIDVAAALKALRSGQQAAQ